MALVIATFIITAVFVGYHASQESHKEIAKVHGEITELGIHSQIKQTFQTVDVKAILG